MERGKAGTADKPAFTCITQRGSLQTQSVPWGRSSPPPGLIQEGGTMQVA